jgi:ganglioside-induced differentiation-associated protein 1
MLDLYHHGSSACAAKVRFVLEEKHIEWNGHVVDIFRGEQFKPDFLALNPKAVVPVLVHDGFVIPESTVICEYLEEAFAQHPIFPVTPKARAQGRLWTKAVDEELHPACSAITYIVSHRHTILRNGAGSFESFLNSGGSEGIGARKQKWEWIQHGIDAPGALEKIRLYDAYLHKMEQALRDSNWLVEDQFSMADIAMTPYVNRIAALSMEGMWTHGRLPRVQEWFARVRARAAFDPAFVRWMPQSLAMEMRQNGEQSWPKIREALEGK